MRVLCIKLLDAKGNETPTSAWATLDSEYVVLAVETADQRVRLRMMADDGLTPALFEPEMFMTISSDIPSSWVASIGEGGTLDLAPAKWLRPGFWEDYFSGEGRAVSDFETEKKRLIAEAS